jgi:hypothetical protein
LLEKEEGRDDQSNGLQLKTKEPDQIQGERKNFPIELLLTSDEWGAFIVIVLITFLR